VIRIATRQYKAKGVIKFYKEQTSIYSYKKGNLMKKIILVTILLSSFSAYTSELTILNWYRLDSRSTSNSAAEVCFSLTPKPTAPTFVEITVDAGTRVQGQYSTWIGPKGVACHVVSTVRGRVEVNVPSLQLKQELINK
jgi:hypothetical protein